MADIDESRLFFGRAQECSMPDYGSKFAVTGDKPSRAKLHHYQGEDVVTMLKTDYDAMNAMNAVDNSTAQVVDDSTPVPIWTRAAQARQVVTEAMRLCQRVMDEYRLYCDMEMSEINDEYRLNYDMEMSEITDPDPQQPDMFSTTAIVVTKPLWLSQSEHWAHCQEITSQGALGCDCGGAAETSPSKCEGCITHSYYCPNDEGDWTALEIEGCEAYTPVKKVTK